MPKKGRETGPNEPSPPRKAWFFGQPKGIGPNIEKGTQEGFMG